MEFALTAPVLVAILVGIIELGILVTIYVGLSNSAREGARAASIYRYDGAAPTTGNETAAMATMDGERLTALTDAISDTLNPLIASDNLTVTVDYPLGASVENPYRAGQTISVTLETSHELFWGLLGRRELTLRAMGAARIEPGNTIPPTVTP